MPSENLAALKDLTDRLVNKELMYKKIIDCAPDVIVVADTSGKIKLINDRVESVFGYTKDELIGQSVEVLMPERFREAHLNKTNGYSKDSPIICLATEGLGLIGLRKDGTEFPVSIGLAPVNTAWGLFICSCIREL